MFRFYALIKSRFLCCDPLLIKVLLVDKEPIYKILIRYFDRTASLKWLAAGFVIGFLGWIWGESPYPVLVLKLASGFGWLLMALIFVATIFSLMAFYFKGRVGHLAKGDFQNALSRGHHKLLRATSVLFGLVLNAAVCWGFTGSISALGTVLYGSLLGGTLLSCWGGLAIIADELSKRSFPSNI